MRIAVVPGPGGGGQLQTLGEDGQPVGAAETVTDLAAAVTERERRAPPRWVWTSTPEVYPRLLSAGGRVERCHDLALTEALLLGDAGSWGAPRSLAAAWARLHGLPVPDDPRPRTRTSQPVLFETDETGLPAGVAPLTAVVAVHAAQLQRIAAVEHPSRMRLLAAVESAGALAAAEMTRHGLPWSVEAHHALLSEQLGSRPAAGTLPRRLVTLSERISEAFGGRRVNPDSPAEVIRAFAAAGIDIPSTRSWVLRETGHPAAPLLLEYKELARLHAAHGWHWLEAWVRDRRFRPEWVAGGVVSGRWATRGGGALQIPRAVRRAVVADPGHVLVVADAAQLEPRVLAALSGDDRLAQAAGAGDLYTALAADAFGGERSRAKVALLAAMYGQTGGEAAPMLGLLHRRFPDAVAYVEQAARAGEAGQVVRSRLGRTCPPPSHPAATGQPADLLSEAERRQAERRARDRGRFTRNFVVQASAADWALTVLAGLRQRLSSLPGGKHPGEAAPELVFFQHDEVIVHCPRGLADAVVAAATGAARDARRLVFGDTAVRFPLEVGVVECYADHK